MREWFDSLQPRERWILAGGAAAALLLLLYFGIVRPVGRGSSLAATRVDSKLTLLAELRAAAGQVRAAGDAPTTTPASNDSLVVLVDRSIRQSGLGSEFKGTQPSGANGVRVRFDDASFDKILDWLGSIQAQYGLGIVSASFDGNSAQPGLVTANLVLERLGS